MGIQWCPFNHFYCFLQRLIINSKEVWIIDIYFIITCVFGKKRNCFISLQILNLSGFHLRFLLNFVPSFGSSPVLSFDLIASFFSSNQFTCCTLPCSLPLFLSVLLLSSLFPSLCFIPSSLHPLSPSSPPILICSSQWRKGRRKREFFCRWSKIGSLH